MLLKVIQIGVIIKTNIKWVLHTPYFIICTSGKGKPNLACAVFPQN